MPFTFSHPAAVLPLRRWCPDPVDFTAAVIGSMTPDVGYYLQCFDLASFAHSFFGTLEVDLPIGLLLLGGFCLVRRPICFILPEPHREALTPRCSSQGRPGIHRLVILACSIVVGAWTHIFWDSFTHVDGWFVQNLEYLRKTVIGIGGVSLPLYYVLQQLSTLCGAAILITAYLKWLRRSGENRSTTRESDLGRYALWAAIILVSLTVSVALAAPVAKGYDGYLAVRVFIFSSAVYSTSIAVPLIIVSAIVAYRAVFK